MFPISPYFCFCYHEAAAAVNKPCPFKSQLRRNLYKVHHELCQCFPIVIMNGFKLIMGAIVAIISLLLTSWRGMVV